MLTNKFVQHFLFLLIAGATWLASLPLGALAWLFPDWTDVTRAYAATEILSHAAEMPSDSKTETPYFQSGDSRFTVTPGNCWTVGFGKSNLTEAAWVREKAEAGGFQVAGYTNTPSTGILDDLFAKAVYLDDNTGRGGLLYAVVDCIGLSDTDVGAIRALVWDWAAAAGIRGIQIAATHTHAGIDTIGLWRDIPFTGLDAAFQEHLYRKTAEALKSAYENRTDGTLYLADTELTDWADDTRTPRVFDETVTRLRFAPDDAAKKDIYILNSACHPELMGPYNGLISADHLGAAAAYIKERTGCEVLNIQGALGGLITAPDLQSVIVAQRTGDMIGRTRVQAFGEALAKAALGESGSLSRETVLPAVLNFTAAQYEVPVDNVAFVCAIKAKMINHAVYTVHWQKNQYAMTAECGYLRLGDADTSLDVLIASSEPFPELFFGGFLPAEESANGTDYTRPAIFELLNDYPFASRRQIVFGLANNFTGYIIPENDFSLHPLLPYFNVGYDRFDRKHYEETTSTSPRHAQLLTEAYTDLFAGIAWSE